MPPPKQQQPPQPPPPEEPPREEIVDAFQKFKKDPRLGTRFVKEQRPLQTSVSQDNNPLLSSATSAVSQLAGEFGLPSFLSSYKQTQQVSWALLHQEEQTDEERMDAPAPNDRIVFSNRGETYGRKIIDNQLFFEKAFPQYKVWSYDAFIDHHMNHAADAERFDLLNSQILSADANFLLILDQQITRLIFERPLSIEFEQNLGLQRKTLLEKYPTLNFQNTPNGRADLLFLIRSTQLIFGKLFPQLRQRPILSALSALTPLTIFSSNQLQHIKQAYAILHSADQNRNTPFSDE